MNHITSTISMVNRAVVLTTITDRETKAMAETSMAHLMTEEIVPTKEIIHSHHMINIQTKGTTTMASKMTRVNICLPRKPRRLRNMQARNNSILRLRKSMKRTTNNSSL